MKFFVACMHIIVGSAVCERFFFCTLCYGHVVVCSSSDGLVVISGRFEQTQHYYGFNKTGKY